MSSSTLPPYHISIKNIITLIMQMQTSSILSSSLLFTEANGRLDFDYLLL